MAEVGIIGSGNLAWHLAGALAERAVTFSRRPREVRADWPGRVAAVSDLRDRSPRLIVLAVPDNAIAPVTGALFATDLQEVPVVHTSGAAELAAIHAGFVHRGVLWPIRSLRAGEPLTDWRDLPLVLQAGTDRCREALLTLTEGLSDTITWLDDRQRAQLHLAAVFSNNFVTALYEIAHELCGRHAVPFDLLLPIIRDTALSQDGRRPADRQTGAAARGDTATMERHLGLLERPAYRDLYRDISRLILEYRLPEHDADLGGEADDDL